MSRAINLVRKKEEDRNEMKNIKKIQIIRFMLKGHTKLIIFYDSTT